MVYFFWGGLLYVRRTEAHAMTVALLRSSTKQNYKWVTGAFLSSTLTMVNIL